jgi:hypothetical protein
MELDVPVKRARRDHPRVDYKEPTERDIYVEVSKLSKPSNRIKKSSKSSDIYPIEVVDEDSSTSQVRVHYIGYSSECDEWKTKKDIISLCDDDPDPTPYTESEILVRFSLYGELRSRIKAALNSGRKDSPMVKIDLPFDRLEYGGGLCLCGTKKRLLRGVQHYSIAQYQNLDHLLGKNWHYRGLNSNGDFCYVLLDTVYYYLYRRRPIREYVPGQPCPALQSHEIGDMLVFTFVKENGTPDRFGKDKNFFLK